MPDAKTIKTLKMFQVNEITEHHIYKKLSSISKDKKNSIALGKISDDELRHYNIWKKFSGSDVKLNKRKYCFYVIVSVIFGVTFAIKLMENGEKGAQRAYSDYAGAIPETIKIIEDEEKHENELIAMINEEKLKYIGSVVLGLNDAIVELTGTLAGLTFALRNARITGMAGLIMGIAAALSMAASEYLSTKTEAGERSPGKASFYTLIAYTTAVFFLVAPYLLVNNYLLCLALTLLSASIMIFFFTYYYSVVREISFRNRFIEMFSISMGVAFLSFIIGDIANRLLNGGRPL